MNTKHRFIQLVHQQLGHTLSGGYIQQQLSINKSRMHELFHEVYHVDDIIHMQRLKLTKKDRNFYQKHKGVTMVSDDWYAIGIKTDRFYRYLQEHGIQCKD